MTIEISCSYSADEVFFVELVVIGSELHKKRVLIDFNEYLT